MGIVRGSRRRSARRRVQAGVAALLCAGLAACAPNRKSPQDAAPPVTVAHPIERTVADWDDYLGQFAAVNAVDVRPRVSGYLQSVGFRDGDMVKKGQVLFVIDPRPYQAALDQALGQQAHAAAVRDNAEADGRRGVQLLAAHAISQQAYDALAASARQAEADAASAGAAVAAARLNLGFTRVTAPIAGRISDRRVSPGNLVAADQTVLTNIVDINPIWFEFTGSEALYLKYQRANAAGTRTSSRQAPNPVEIRLQDETAFRWTGRMDFVDNAIDMSSGAIRGRAVVQNPDGFLTPGMFGHMRLLGSGPYRALLVPDRAIVTDQTKQAVYVVAPGGAVSERIVEIGPVTEGLRVVRSGLTATDLVIIDGVQRARPGHRVTPRPGTVTPQPADAAESTAPPPLATSAKLTDPSR